jgi:hypothetical protein
MTQMVSLSVLVFMIGMAFMFWLGSLASSKHNLEPNLEAPQDAEQLAGEASA